MKNFTYNYSSPIGFLKIITEDKNLTYLGFEEDTAASYKLDEAPEIMKKTVSELNMYFEGRLKQFTVCFAQKATDFRMRVFSELIKIPYGETISYKELAIRIGSPMAVRAVGGANHNNGISIIVPCHRVIGADGSLTGFGGGLDKKRYLLELERRNT